MNRSTSADFGTGTRRGSFVDVLLKRGLLRPEDVADVRKHAEGRGLPFEKYVLQDRIVAQDKFALAAAEYF